MASFQEAISSAVKTQATRRGIAYQDIAASMQISRSSFWRHLSNKQLWNSEDFDKLAAALGLSSSWDLLQIAQSEQELASSYGSAA
jgi:AcrR family transcriptional regulator